MTACGDSDETEAARFGLFLSIGGISLHPLGVIYPQIVADSCYASSRDSSHCLPVLKIAATPPASS